MKKFLVVGGILLMVVIFAGFGPMNRDGLIYENLPGVSVEGTITDLSIIDGKYVLTVETESEKVYVHIPLVVLRTEGLSLNVGDKIGIEGKEVVTTTGKWIVVEEFEYNGKEYDVRSVMEEFVRSRRNRGYGHRFGNEAPQFQNEWPARGRGRRMMGNF